MYEFHASWYQRHYDVLGADAKHQRGAYDMLLANKSKLEQTLNREATAMQEKLGLQQALVLQLEMLAPKLRSLWSKQYEVLQTHLEAVHEKQQIACAMVEATLEEDVELSEKMSQVQNQISELLHTTQIAKLEQALQPIIVQIQQAAMAVATITQKLQALEANCDETREQWSILVCELEAIRQSKQPGSGQSVELSRKVSRLQARLVEQGHVKRQLEAKLEAAQALHTQRQSEQTKQLTQLSKLRSLSHNNAPKVQDANSHLVNLQGLRDSIASKLADRTSVQKDIQAKLSKLEAEKTALETLQSAFQRDVDFLAAEQQSLSALLAKNQGCKPSRRCGLFAPLGNLADLAQVQTHWRYLFQNFRDATLDRQDAQSYIASAKRELEQLNAEIKQAYVAWQRVQQALREYKNVDNTWNDAKLSPLLLAPYKVAIRQALYATIKQLKRQYAKNKVQKTPGMVCWILQTARIAPNYAAIGALIQAILYQTRTHLKQLPHATDIDSIARTCVLEYRTYLATQLSAARALESACFRTHLVSSLQQAVAALDKLATAIEAKKLKAAPSAPPLEALQAPQMPRIRL